MSKMDNLRAMREAKYARSQERGTASAPGAAKRAARPAVAPRGAAAAKAAAGKVSAGPAETAANETAADETAEELCGHRNMSGRTCTRERGHAAKSHRYS